MAQTSREAFQKAAKASTHQARRWTAGQWVYVYRRGRPNSVLHPRDRWCGPGIIVLVSQKGIYVAMRSRLWRCGSEQLRPAHPNEMLGAQMAEDPGLAEILRKINSEDIQAAPQARVDLELKNRQLRWSRQPRLLQAIPRLPPSGSSSVAGQASTSSTASPLTPDEQVTGSGRVGQQIAEFESLRPHREQSPRRGNEAQALAEEERKLFEQSDKVEWEAMLATGAVRVLTGKEAREARRKFPDRILSSRMVLPDKLNAWKAKSRWCIQGHSDPDTSELQTYAPTPSTEGLMMFLQTATNLRQECAFADVRNAFCQSLPLSRSKGPLFAEGCEGLNLPPEALIALDVPVYGLDDAPAAWRKTVVDFLLSIGFIRHITEPCWYLRFNSDKQNEAQVLVEVDDLIVATNPEVTESIKKTFQERFHFGKWEYGEAEYAGRKVFPIQVAKGRRQLKDDKLNEEEFGLFRSLIYKVNWLARESRPEAAGLASIMACRLPHAQLKDIFTINKYVNHLRSTAARAIKIWRFEPEEMVFISVSDAGGVTVREGETDEEGLPTDAAQGAWAVFTAEGHPVGAQQVKATPVAWRSSSKLKRKVFSTFGGETQAMLQGVNEVEWLQIMYRDAIFNDIQLDQWRNSLSPHLVIMKSAAHLPARQPQISVTDAKSLFDCLLREHPQGRQDRKSALELAIILRDLQSTRSSVRWTPHQKMVVDCLTKDERSNGAMEMFLRLQSDVENVHFFMSMGLGYLISSVGQFVAGITVAMMHGPRLTLSVCAFLPLLFCAGRSMGQQLEQQMGRQQQDFAKAAAVAKESLMGIRTVAAFGGELRQQELFASQLMQARDGGIRAGVKIGMSWGVLNFIFASLYAVTLYVGGHGLLTGATSKQGGDVVTVLISLITGMGGVNSFSGYLPTMTKALASAAALKLGRG
ncbi:Abcb1 [Symbiodinium sp. CCMP2456]|nr:Abcb1 [Symbiodinium sp. CCMP2456]